MNGLPYYKAYPRDFIEGTIGMSFELKGAYRLVLDLIYMQGGNLPDDDRYIAGLLGCTIRKWRSLRNELVDAGKLQIIGEFLSNERAVFELETLRKLGEKQAENRSRPNKINGLKSPKPNHTEPEPDTTLNRVVTRKRDDDFEGLSQKLEEAGRGKIQPHSLVVIGPIVEMITSGISLDLDILPTIQAISLKLNKTVGLSYFLGPIREAYERRIGAVRDLPRPKPLSTSDADWSRRLRFARQNKIWSAEEWGPMPQAAGCAIPSHLLQAGDGEGWVIAAQRSAA